MPNLYWVGGGGGGLANYIFLSGQELWSIIDQLSKNATCLFSTFRQVLFLIAFFNPITQALDPILQPEKKEKLLRSQVRTEACIYNTMYTRILQDYHNGFR
jgi:hypothetical protein